MEAERGSVGGDKNMEEELGQGIWRSRGLSDMLQCDPHSESQPSKAGLRDMQIQVSQSMFRQVVPHIS